MPQRRPRQPRKMGRRNKRSAVAPNPKIVTGKHREVG